MPPTGDYVAYSTNSNRTNPQNLNGATLPTNQNVYIHLGTTTTNYTTVQLWIDDPTTQSTPDKTERMAPYDLEGGTIANAKPLNTADLSTGTHTLTTTSTSPNGTTQTITATFTIGTAGL